MCTWTLFADSVFGKWHGPRSSALVWEATVHGHTKVSDVWRERVRGNLTNKPGCLLPLPILPTTVSPNSSALLHIPSGVFALDSLFPHTSLSPPPSYQHLLIFNSPGLKIEKQRRGLA